VILFSLQGMLAFVIAGMAYFVVKRWERFRYYKAMFIFLSIINVFMVVLWSLLKLWIPAVLTFLGIVLGYGILRKHRIAINEANETIV
jgi:uncharacterized membrane protein YfhO